MKLLVCFVFFVARAGAIQDLSGKMFTFPLQTKTDHVKLITSKRNLSAATVCHRSFTDLKRDHNLFSKSTQASPNEFLVFYDYTNKEIEIHLKNQKAEYRSLDYKPNTWHSVCTTWDAGSGLVQLWFNGQPLTRRFVNQSNMTGEPIIILGQEQDSHGGGFDINQSFIGMMTDVHMWDYVLSTCEIQHYVSELSFTPGNVLNWAALDFQINGRVLIENKQMYCQ
ncbi:serum amyloid P-component-like [Periophthalmus magnuspinnatus]|uniref:serum amyloid P-component-like n=1 Tax=Periophthalmus magnuspinnatus TaxID=409849 RepID=UPI00145A95B4|nr:serum amyloid P-component-like [Periophthalmus magnuspinnatus]